MKIDKRTQLTIAYAILAVLLLLSMQNYLGGHVDNVAYSEFRQWVKQGEVKECTFTGEYIRGTVYQGGQDRSFVTTRVEDSDLVPLLEEHDVKYSKQPDNTWFSTLLSWILPAVIFVGIWMFMARRMTGGSSGLMAIGKSKAKMVLKQTIETYLDQFPDCIEKTIAFETAYGLKIQDTRMSKKLFSTQMQSMFNRKLIQLKKQGVLQELVLVEKYGGTLKREKAIGI